MPEGAGLQKSSYLQLLLDNTGLMAAVPGCSEMPGHLDVQTCQKSPNPKFKGHAQ